MTRWLIPAGLILVLLGMIFIILGSALSGSGDVESGGVVFIGPIPILFGSNKKMAVTAGIIGAAILLFAFFRYWA